VVEPTDAGKLDDPATARRLDGARDRRVATERHVRSVLVAIGDMLAEQAQQMPLPKHDDVIEQLATYRADPSFRVSVLPRRTRRGAHLPDAEVVDPCVERRAEDGISISGQPRRHARRADGIYDLLRGPRGPRGVRVRRHVDVQHTAPVEREDEKDLEDVERDRWHGQKVDRDRSPRDGRGEGLPRLRRGTAWSRSWLRHVLGDHVLVAA
jgi:hypothetical protein